MLQKNGKAARRRRRLVGVVIGALESGNARTQSSISASKEMQLWYITTQHTTHGVHSVASYFRCGQSPLLPSVAELTAAAAAAVVEEEEVPKKLVRITDVLNHMLSSSRYDSNLRPGLDIRENNVTGEKEVVDDEPAAVAINMLIKNLGPIDEENMMYAMEIYFRQSWVDNRLRFDADFVNQDEIKVSISTLDKIWRPDTYFFNGKGSKLHVITTPNKLLRIQADGTVFFSMRLTIKAVCFMDFRKFPVDKQACPLLIGSYAYDSKNLVYVWWEEAKSKSALHQIPANVINSTSKNLGVEVTAMAQFLFRPEGVAFSHELSKLGSETRDVLSLTIPLERMIGYYLLQIYLPSYMTVSMSWVTFWINREATPGRVTL
uniref:Neur_chan_LBD domain-containing protein n=1 Tax=Macrostomum lignano TaxID=282301 RepID=A0A1I8IVV4_9PLAT